ncbi:MAG: DUF2934 domain-containing protein [Hyphomicrobiales bacterium]|nr:DUF2934 domain-containing protein [Hyphomicrobiales bacterium]
MQEEEERRSENASASSDPDEERIRRKAYELWIAEGKPEGRHLDHWELARELIAIEDSQKTTLRAPPKEDEVPAEPPEAFENQGDVPGLTDQGEGRPGPSLDAAAEVASEVPLSHNNGSPKKGSPARP